MKILVAYDGSMNSRTALQYGIKRIKERGGELRVMHVFPVNMFIDYGAGPKAEEIARRESSGHVEDAKKILADAGSGIKADIILKDGYPEEEIERYARAEKADLILSPPRYKSIVKKAPCPVSIIPGNIIVTIDNTGSFMQTMEKVRDEAVATGSGVILFGIIPVHLYSRGEKKELERMQKDTTAMVKKAKKVLNEQGVETKEIIRSGYPDEEILRVANEYPVTMIVIPESGETPSELGKAASIILDSPDIYKKPVMLVPSEKTA
jgi:nucleotide-binding universal stress UspA family protein